MRPSEIRSISVTPALSSFFGTCYKPIEESISISWWGRLEALFRRVGPFERVLPIRPREQAPGGEDWRLCAMWRWTRPSGPVNAIVDALRSLGITTLDMPATPLRIWAAIQGARCDEIRSIP